MKDTSGNAPAFDPARPARRGHVESYFIKLNSPDGRHAVWLKWTIFAPIEGPVRQESWAIVFERGSRPRAVKRSEPIAPTAISRVPFGLGFTGQQFDGRHTKGNLEGQGLHLAWDMTLVPQLVPLWHLPNRWLYYSFLPETKLTSPIPDAIAHGSVWMDGKRLDVTGWRAMQGHNWGRRHVNRYAWCHAAGFDGANDIVFEAVAARLGAKGLELPWLVLAFLWIDGAWIRFDGPRVASRARCEASVMALDLDTEAQGHRLRAHVVAERKETAGLHYANPRGPMTCCLNSKLALLTIELDGQAGTHTLRTSRASFELGWPTADHGITMLA